MKTARFYFKFQEQFVDAVRSGRKSRTIRATRARVPQPGDQVILEHWSGLAYRSKVKKIGKAVFKAVTPIRIEAWDGCKEGVKILLNGVELIDWEAKALAESDGFASLQDFAEFFRNRLPFAGHLYEWHNP